MDPALVRSVGEYLVRPYWWHGSKRWFPDPIVADTGRSGAIKPVTREVKDGSADRGAGAIGSGKSQRGALLAPLERKYNFAHEAACRQPGRLAMKLVRTSKPTATRAIRLLVDASVLVETAGRRRYRSFAYQTMRKAAQ